MPRLMHSRATRIHARINTVHSVFRARRSVPLARIERPHGPSEGKKIDESRQEEALGAADTCRASASATNGKEEKKKKEINEKREERIKELKGQNKVSLKTRPRKREKGRGEGRVKRMRKVETVERAETSN
ncbi:hypothetical protein PUN28_015632 [Cardiocondyla obscurior]|uniref:Uncharacterized protein n=1 Tax=Cardiocondyla obscurior TaxID=286306 RepID=A0AAW2EXA1_9HYME